MTFCKRRTRGNGHLLKRGNIYYLRIEINGQRKTISLKTGDEKTARQKAADYSKLTNSDTIEEIALHVGQAKKIISGDTIALDDVWEKYLNNPGRPDSSTGTLGNYKRNWNAFKSWLAEEHLEIKHLEQINESIAKEYAEYLWKPKKQKEKMVAICANTYNYHIQSLSLISRKLSNNSSLYCNPWKAIERKVEEKQSRKEFIEDEIIKLLNIFRNEDFKTDDKAEMEILFHIGIWTGVRLIDAALFKWEYINWNQDIIKFIPHKTRKIRREVIIPILPQLRDELHKAVKWKDPSGYVLPNIARRYSKAPHEVNDACLEVLRISGFNHEVHRKRGRSLNLYGFHSLRHTFASICAEKGIPIAKLAAMLGDNITTLEKYYIKIQDKALTESLTNALPHSTILPKQLPLQNEAHKDTEILNQIKQYLKSQKKLSPQAVEILKMIS